MPADFAIEHRLKQAYLAERVREAEDDTTSVLLWEHEFVYLMRAIRKEGLLIVDPTKRGRLERFLVRRRLLRGLGLGHRVSIMDAIRNANDPSG